MLRHYALLVDHHHSIHIAFDQNLAMRIGDGHGIIIVIKPDQR